MSRTLEIRVERFLDDAMSTMDASVAFVVDGQVLNVGYDLEAATQRASSDVSALQLANWLCDNWWRLNFEAASDSRKREPSWRLAHDLASAGGGSAWPPLRFESDGEVVQVELFASRSVLRPVHYLTPATAAVGRPAVETAIDHFVARVLARGRALHLSSDEFTALSENWALLVAERTDRSLRSLRIAEARMGLDPESYTPEEMERLLSPLRWTGDSALTEVLAVVRDSELQRDIGAFAALETAGGARIDATDAIDLCGELPSATTGAAWKVGVELASRIRAGLGVGHEPLAPETFDTLLGTSTRELFQGGAASGLPHGAAGTAVRASTGEAYDLRISGAHPIGRRFKAARVLGDIIVNCSADRLSPATGAVTYRQKLNRAFAQELLLPAEALEAALTDGAPIEDTIEEVANRYDVSDWTVRSALVNKGLVPDGAVLVPA